MNTLKLETVTNTVDVEKADNTVKLELINVETVQYGLMGLQTYEGVELVESDN